MPRTLPPRQQRFVAEYLLDLNATQACIRAGYSAKTADVQGPRLLGNVRVAAAISKAQEKRLARMEVQQDEVLRELLRIGTSDIRKLYDENGRMRPIHELPDEIALALSGVEVLREKTTVRGTDILETTVEESVRKIRLWDKPRALELLAKHLGLLKDTVRFEGDAPITFTLNLGNPRVPTKP